jgi:hypothetical protein
MDDDMIRNEFTLLFYPIGARYFISQTCGLKKIEDMQSTKGTSKQSQTATYFTGQ